MNCELPKTISFRTVLTLVCLGLIACTAITTLSVTYVFSYAAAEQIASDHALALARKATGDVENFLNQPVGTIVGLQYMFGRDSFPLPSDVEPSDAMWYREWWHYFVSAMAATNFAYQFVVAGFNDGYYSGCKLLLTPGQFECRAFSWMNRATTGYSTTHTEDYYISNYSLVLAFNGTTKYDPRTRSWFSVPNHTLGSMAWSAPYLSAMPTLPVVDIDASLFNGSGTFLGVLSLTYDLSSISRFLSSLQTTPNTKALIVDNTNLLLASTFAVPYMEQLPLPPNYTSATPIPSNCVASDVANGAQPVLLCRYAASEYPYAPLQDLVRKYPDALNAGTVGTQKLWLDGAAYYAAVQHIVTPGAANMGWRCVLLMPEADVIGGIIDGRNYAIIITAAILVASAVCSYMLVRVILKPLDVLAERMYETATLNEDDDVVTELSGFDEMHTIQVAFDLLTSELKKVKSYLPQSVMAALYGDAADEDEEEMTSPVTKGLPGITIAVVEETSDSAPGSRRQSGVGRQSQTGSKVNLLVDLQRKSAYGDTAGGLAPAGAGASFRSVARSEMGGKASAGLNTALKLMQRKVTVLYVNVSNFHAFAKQTTNDELLGVHSELLSTVCRLAKDAKGVLDGFQGDRFVLTFNAVTNVGNHACAAAGCALALLQHLLELQTTSGRRLQGVTCGLASGPCVVGNMGSATVKRFSIIGQAFGQALVLERLCKKYTGARVLLSSATIPDIENFYEHSIQDILMLPAGSDGVPKRQFVTSLIGAKVVSCDEWMYQLSEGQGASKFTAHNAAFGSFMRGDAAKAQEENGKALQRSQQEDETPETYAVHRAPALALQRLLDEDVSGASYFNSMGDYFTTCVADATKAHKLASG